MSKYQKILLQILRRRADKNIEFDHLRNLLTRLGFEERIKGSHHIFTKTDVVEILNIQSNAGKAKPYQVKQVRNLIKEYRLILEDDEK